MAFSYRIDLEAGMLFLSGEGVMTQTERLDAMRIWISDPAFRPGLSTLCDFSNLASTPTLPELQQIASFIEEHAHRIGRKRVAIVAPQSTTFGVARQFGALAAGGPLNVRVFNEHHAALTWLQERRA